MEPTVQELGGCTAEQFAAVLGALKSDKVAAAALCGIFSSRDSLTELKYGVNTMFLVFSGALVFIMHGGFAMLCAGALRSKNALNILLQTIMDAAASAIMFYLLGFGFAYGQGANRNRFIGDALFGMARWDSHNTGTGLGMWHNWFFQWAFAATATTIPAGCVAERFNFNAYLGYSVFISGFVYPVVVHWVWAVDGWLGYGTTNPIFKAGMIDFAGSGVVHMVGGLAGLVGAVMVGPRLGRFDMNGAPVHMPGHSAILVVLGTCLLWFGWYGFNPGSVLLIDTVGNARVAGRAAVTTTLSGASAGLTCLMLGFRKNLAWDLISLCNGMLVGFVSITAGCHVLEPWAAMLCGATAGCMFDIICHVLLKLRIDDPLCAYPMHGFCGMWGVLFVGLLAKKAFVEEAYVGLKTTYPYGLFYGGGGWLLASQVVGVLAIIVWVVGLMVPFFYVFKLCKSLRIPPEQEELGLDVSKHGGSAYNFTGVGDAIMRQNTMGYGSAHSHKPVQAATLGGSACSGGVFAQMQHAQLVQVQSAHKLSSPAGVRSSRPSSGSMHMLNKNPSLRHGHTYVHPDAGSEAAAAGQEPSHRPSSSYTGRGNGEAPRAGLIAMGNWTCPQGAGGAVPALQMDSSLTAQNREGSAGGAARGAGIASDPIASETGLVQRLMVAATQEQQFGGVEVMHENLGVPVEHV